MTPAAATARTIHHRPPRVVLAGGRANARQIARTYLAAHPGATTREVAFACLYLIEPERLMHFGRMRRASWRRRKEQEGYGVRARRVISLSNQLALDAVVFFGSTLAGLKADGYLRCTTEGKGRGFEGKWWLVGKTDGRRNNGRRPRAS